MKGNKMKKTKTKSNDKTTTTTEAGTEFKSTEKDWFLQKIHYSHRHDDDGDFDEPMTLDDILRQQDLEEAIARRLSW